MVIKIQRLLILFFLSSGIVLCNAYADGGSRLYREGEKYLKSGSDDFAFMRFRRLIKDYPESKYAEKASIKIIDYYYQEKYFKKLKRAIDDYFRMYPNGEYVEKVNGYLVQARKFELLKQADYFVDNEAWKDAIDTYNSILELDSSSEHIKDKIKHCTERYNNSVYKEYYDDGGME